MSPGEIYLASFPFGGTVGAKIRPVLLLTGPIGPVPEVLVGYITSVVSGNLLSTDVLLDPSRPECKATNLKTVSILRLHKLATIHQTDLVRSLGVLSPAVWQEDEIKLRLLLQL